MDLVKLWERSWNTPIFFIDSLRKWIERNDEK